uniref:Uncharacterized protein n=1 Tax=Sphaerodactylus townsendi TaxID=933632 RepID=A0ACB8EPG9_9SAUR
MFLFAHKTSTPISTYKDSYRVPCLTKESYSEPSLKAWTDQLPLSKGLTVPRLDNQVDQAHLEKMVKNAVQEYTYKNSIEPTAYRPYKYWVTREEALKVVFSYILPDWCERLSYILELPTLGEGSKVALGWQLLEDHAQRLNGMSSHNVSFSPVTGSDVIKARGGLCVVMRCDDVASS